MGLSIGIGIGVPKGFSSAAGAAPDGAYFTEDTLSNELFVDDAKTEAYVTKD